MSFTYFKQLFLPLFAVTILFFSCTSRPEDSKTAVPGQESFFIESHRPQFHFSPKEMWMNDPNGMVYHEGVYHLFYQHYPDDKVWGPMHWGHAKSPNMINWKHEPIALYP
ncbi:glycoside hydrolase family 32 protein, partial [Bacteroidota bacterium]